MARYGRGPAARLTVGRRRRSAVALGRVLDRRRELHGRAVEQSGAVRATRGSHPEPGCVGESGESWTLSAARYWTITVLRGLVPRFAVELWSMLQWWISTPPAGD